MKNTYRILDHAMATIKVDFETIACGQRLFKCLSELHLDDSYQHINYSTIRKWLIKKQRLESIIDSKLAIEFNLASIRQEPSIIAEKVMQCNASILAQKMAKH